MNENSVQEVKNETEKAVSPQRQTPMAEHPNPTDKIPRQPRRDPTRRAPWDALTLAVAIIAVVLGGVFVLSNWNTNRAQQVLLAEQARLIRLTINAAEAQIAILTADAENAAAEIGALTAEARVNATGTVRAERTAAQATFDSHMMETEAKARANATETVGAERTAAQATFAEHMVETARIITREAAVAETQAESARLTQVSIDGTATAEAEAIRIAQAQTATEAAEATQAAKYQVGDIIRFGRYEQDNDLSNGAEAIEWRILAIEGDTALVVSVMGLDAKPYNEEYADITWEDCTLRAWLNNEFYNAAFNEAERAKIERTHVVNEDNPKYSTEGGNDTEDDVFLPSIAEAERYFRDSEDRKMKPTKYAIANGAWTNSGNGNGWWWLRSPGTYQYEAAEVSSDGDIISYGDLVISIVDSVRPALRINLGK